jgi:hypothetical protein
MLRFFLSLLFALSFAASVSYAETPQERQAQQFTEMDDNKDGKVSLEEFKAHYTRKGSEEAKEAAFKAADTDGDGTWSLKEYQAYRGKAKATKKASKKT